MQREEIQRLLRENGLTPNRALGQNFLADEQALGRILEGARVEGAPVLEIGPGLGALTEGLLARASRVAAVEIDGAMVKLLRARFGEEPRLLLVHGDFLKAPLSPIHAFLGGGSFHVAANLPYYATSPICMRLFTSGLPIASMTLMLQREAAARFAARPGDRVYGPLSVLAQAYYEVKPLLTLSPESYYPRPQVDSAVISLRRNREPLRAGLPALLEAAFAMRRKTLANNLKARGLDPGALPAAGIDAAARAESLDAEDFFRLLQKLEA